MSKLLWGMNDGGVSLLFHSALLAFLIVRGVWLLLRYLCGDDPKYGIYALRPATLWFLKFTVVLKWLFLALLGTSWLAELLGLPGALSATARAAGPLELIGANLPLIVVTVALCWPWFMRWRAPPAGPPRPDVWPGGNDVAVLVEARDWGGLPGTTLADHMFALARKADGQIDGPGLTPSNVGPGETLERCHQAVVACGEWSRYLEYVIVCTSGGERRLMRSAITVKARAAAAKPPVRQMIAQAYESMMGTKRTLALYRRRSLEQEGLFDQLDVVVRQALAAWVKEPMGSGGSLEDHLEARLSADALWTNLNQVMTIEAVRSPSQVGSDQVECYPRMSRVFGPRRIEPFEMDTFPVTNEDYGKFLADLTERDEDRWRHPKDPRKTPLVPDGWSAKQSNSDHPVTGVSWWAAYAYASWRSQRPENESGKPIRLPTEAEWRCAAGYCWQDENEWLFPGPDARRLSGDPREWCNVDTGATTPVQKYEKNRSPSNCFDMAGNVLEWCADTIRGGFRLVKGGSFESPPTGHVKDWLNVQNRYPLGHPLRASDRRQDLGFRCCRSI